MLCAAHTGTRRNSRVSIGMDIGHALTLDAGPAPHEDRRSRVPRQTARPVPTGPTGPIDDFHQPAARWMALRILMLVPQRQPLSIASMSAEGVDRGFDTARSPLTDPPRSFVSKNARDRNPDTAVILGSARIGSPYS